MFALRGIAVSLTFFVLFYSMLSALVSAAWRALRRLEMRQRTLADSLFALRILPLAASAFLTFAFVVPSFDLLEPRSINEGIGEAPPALGICALLLIVYGCVRVVTAQVRASRIVNGWLQGAQPLDANRLPDTFRSRGEAPPLALVGVRKPKVLVSEFTIAVLTPDELRIAIKHELAHRRFQDNLKKLVFRFCPFPGMAALESAWSEAAELAADDAAVSSVTEAIDLAAALIKLSRIFPVESLPLCAAGFVNGSLRARVARLLAWNQASQTPPQRIPWYFIPPALTALLGVFIAYRPLLGLTHEATEWLVR